MLKHGKNLQKKNRSIVLPLLSSDSIYKRKGFGVIDWLSMYIQWAVILVNRNFASKLQERDALHGLTDNKKNPRWKAKD